MESENRKEGFHVVLTTHNSRSSLRMHKYQVKRGIPRSLSLQEEIILSRIIGDIILTNNYLCTAFNSCKDHVHLILVCQRVELKQIVKVIKGKSAYLFNRVDEDALSKGLKPLGGESRSEDEKKSLDNLPKGFQPLAPSTASRVGNNGTFTSGDDKRMNSLGGESLSEDEKKSLDNLPKGFQPLAPPTASCVGNNGTLTSDHDKRMNPLGGKGKHRPLWSQKFFRADLDIWALAQADPRPGYLYRSSHFNNASYYIRTNRQKHNLPQSEELQHIIDSFLTSEEEAFSINTEL